MKTDMASFCKIRMVRICLLFLSASGLLSQEQSPTWLNTGLGGSSYGMALTAGHAFQAGHGLISSRYIFCGELPTLGVDYPAESAHELGILYGRYARVSAVFVSISAGIGVARMVKRGKFLYDNGNLLFPDRTYEELHYLTIGIPLEAQLFLSFSPSFGMGIYAFGNINPKNSFGGMLVSMELGKLK